MQKKRTVEILEGIIRLNEKGAGLTWRTPNGVRIDTLDEDIIKLIKRSNCSAIVLALEHGDPDMLKIMNKKLDLDVAYDVIKLLVKHGIPQIGIFVIVGYPGETRTRFNNCVNYLKKIKKLNGNISVWVNITQPYPGTKLIKRCQAEGIIDNNLGNFLIKKNLMSTTNVVSITTSDFSAKEVLRRREQIKNIFFPLWKIIVKKVIPYKVINFILGYQSHTRFSTLYVNHKRPQGGV